jgi:hypothetical protein
MKYVKSGKPKLNDERKRMKKGVAFDGMHSSGIWTCRLETWGFACRSVFYTGLGTQMSAYGNIFETLAMPVLMVR